MSGTNGEPNTTATSRGESSAPRPSSSKGDGLERLLVGLAKARGINTLQDLESYVGANRRRSSARSGGSQTKESSAAGSDEHDQEDPEWLSTQDEVARRPSLVEDLSTLLQTSGVAAALENQLQEDSANSISIHEPAPSGQTRIERRESGCDSTEDVKERVERMLERAGSNGALKQLDPGSLDGSINFSRNTSSNGVKLPAAFVSIPASNDEGQPRHHEQPRKPSVKLADMPDSPKQRPGRRRQSMAKAAIEMAQTASGGGAGNLSGAIRFNRGRRSSSVANETGRRRSSIQQEAPRRRSITVNPGILSTRGSLTEPLGRQRMSSPPPDKATSAALGAAEEYQRLEQRNSNGQVGVSMGGFSAFASTISSPEAAAMSGQPSPRTTFKRTLSGLQSENSSSVNSLSGTLPAPAATEVFAEEERKPSRTMDEFDVDSGSDDANAPPQPSGGTSPASSPKKNNDEANGDSNGDADGPSSPFTIKETTSISLTGSENTKTPSRRAKRSINFVDSPGEPEGTTSSGAFSQEGDGPSSPRGSRRSIKFVGDATDESDEVKKTVSGDEGSPLSGSPGRKQSTHEFKKKSSNFGSFAKNRGSLHRSDDGEDGQKATMGARLQSALNRKQMASNSENDDVTVPKSFRKKKKGRAQSILSGSGAFSGSVHSVGSASLLSSGTVREDDEEEEEGEYYDSSDEDIEFQSRAEEIQYFEQDHFYSDAQRQRRRYIRFITPTRKIFTFLSIILMFFNLFAVSIRIGLGSAGMATGFVYFELLLDIITFLAQGLNFLFPYEHRGQLITDLKSMALHYLHSRRRIGIDVISTFPMLIFFFIAGIGNSDFARINTMLRFARFNEFFADLQTYIPNRLHPSVWRLLEYSLDIIVVATCICTFQLLVIRSTPIADTNQWLKIPVFRSNATDLSTENSIHNLKEFGGSDAITLYLWTWLHSISAIADKKMSYPQTDEQFLFALPAVMLSVCVLIVLLSSVEEIVVDIVERGSVKQHKITDALAVMDHMELPEELQDEVLTYYSRMWDICKSFDFNTDSDLLADLPDELRADVEYECNARVIRSIPLFSSVADDQNFVRLLAGELHNCMILPGAPIVVKGEEGDCMFFLSSGDAAVLGGEDGDEIMYYLGAGSFFGETTMLFGGERPNTIVAVTLCVCYVVTDTQFEAIVDEYPEALEAILETAVDQVKDGEDELQSMGAAEGHSGGDDTALYPLLAAGEGDDDGAVQNPLAFRSPSMHSQTSHNSFGESPSSQNNLLKAQSSGNDLLRQSSNEKIRDDLRQRFRRKSMAPPGLGGDGDQMAATPASGDAKEELRQRFRRKSMAPPGLGISNLSPGGVTDALSSSQRKSKFFLSDDSHAHSGSGGNSGMDGLEEHRKTSLQASTRAKSINPTNRRKSRFFGAGFRITTTNEDNDEEEVDLESSSRRLRAAMLTPEKPVRSALRKSRFGGFSPVQGSTTPDTSHSHPTMSLSPNAAPLTPDQDPTGGSKRKSISLEDDPASAAEEAHQSASMSGGSLSTSHQSIEASATNAYKAAREARKRGKSTINGDVSPNARGIKPVLSPGTRAREGSADSSLDMSGTQSRMKTQLDMETSLSLDSTSRRGRGNRKRGKSRAVSRAPREKSTSTEHPGAKEGASSGSHSQSYSHSNSTSTLQINIQSVNAETVDVVSDGSTSSDDEVSTPPGVRPPGATDVPQLAINVMSPESAGPGANSSAQGSPSGASLGREEGAPPIPRGSFRANFEAFAGPTSPTSPATTRASGASIVSRDSIVDERDKKK